MGLDIGDRPEQNVVNVGEELTQDQINAINAGQGPSATNPFLTRTNTFNTTDTAVRITQNGTGEAFRVEDGSANPDTTPFVVTADGRVGIGTTSVGTAALTVSGNAGFTGTNTFTILSGTAVPVTIQNNGSGNSFVVNDVASDTTPFVINNDGSVGIKRSSPSYDLDVNGTVNLSTLRFSDGTTLTTKPSTYDQSLNTTDSPSFAGLTVTDNVSNQAFISNGSGYDVGFYAKDIMSGNTYAVTAFGITFPDNTVQTTAYTGGGGGGGGDFFSDDSMGSLISKSFDGKVYQGNAGGDPTDFSNPYYGNRIGFEYGGLNSYHYSSSNFFYFDAQYLYWQDYMSGYNTYYTPNGITKTGGGFELPKQIYGSGSYQPIYTTDYYTFSGGPSGAESGNIKTLHTNGSMTSGYVGIGYDMNTYGIGITFSKMGSDYDGSNAYTNTVTDFTVDSSSTVTPTNRIRIRINGQDYWVAAELITPV